MVTEIGHNKILHFEKLYIGSHSFGRNIFRTWIQLKATSSNAMLFPMRIATRFAVFIRQKVPHSQTSNDGRMWDTFIQYFNISFALFLRFRIATNTAVLISGKFFDFLARCHCNWRANSNLKERKWVIVIRFFCGEAFIFIFFICSVFSFSTKKNNTKMAWVLMARRWLLQWLSNQLLKFKLSE